MASDHLPIPDRQSNFRGAAVRELTIYWQVVPSASGGHARREDHLP